MAQTSAVVGSPLPNAPVGPQSGAMVPFRKATTERVQILPSENAVPIATTETPIQRTVEGSGYVYGILLRAFATTSGNAATVAFTEDAPWDVFTSLIFEDVNGQFINANGYDVYLANLVDRLYAVRFWDASTNTSLFNLVSGSGATGGTFAVTLRLPLGLNRRDLTGIVGNQDRAQKYQLRTNLNSSSGIYTTPPTTLAPVTIEKYYENYSVPLPQSPTGASQQVVPDTFGTIHYLTATVSDSSPLGGSQVNHYLRRIGNTVRYIVLQFRSNGSRATAEANAPTNIQFKVGEDTLFNETYQYRKALMFERFGFDFPNGILVYDTLHDFTAAAGYEVGDDYYHTQALVNAQFLITYPSGFGSTNNSLRILTDDLQFVAPSAGVAVSA